MYVKFKELHLRNILSFGNNTTIIDLSCPGSTFIVGENIDAGGANGCGKTTLINAFCYAAYNKPLDNISLQKLINTTNGVKNTLMEVRLMFEKNHDTYEVYRCRGEATNIQLLKNGEDITLDSVNETDKLIQSIIGVSYELFTNVVIFSGKSTPFLSRPVSQQRLQTEELFNITLLSEKAAKLKEVIKETEGNISIQNAIIKERQTQEALYAKQINDAETRVKKWEDERVKQIKTIQDQLDSFKTVDIESEKELHRFKAELSATEVQLTSKKKDLTKEKSSLQSEYRKLTDELHHLNDEKCPYCLQKFAGAFDKIADKSKLKDEKELKVEELDSQITDIEAKILETQNQLHEINGLIKYSSLTEAIKAESLASTASDQIEKLKEAVNPHLDALSSLKLQTVNPISYNELDSLKKLLEHQQFMLKLLVDKNSFIRRKIINKTVPFLNKRLMYYTKELGLPHTVKFDDDMTCSVSELGRELDFGNLSGGEEKRVNLALSLAFRDVLHHLHSKLNILFIDEIDASLDSSGVENTFKLLKQKARDEQVGLWIISHRPEAVARFDRSLIIRKENGFSNIVPSN